MGVRVSAWVGLALLAVGCEPDPAPESVETDQGATPGATPTPVSSQLSGVVSDSAGAPVDASLYLLQGSSERQNETESDGSFLYDDVQVGAATLQIRPSRADLAPLDALVDLSGLADTFDVMVPLMERETVPATVTALELHDELTLWIGDDVLTTFFDDQTGAARLADDALDAMLPVGAEVFGAWMLAPAGALADPALDVELRVDVPDGTYALHRAGLDAWVPLGTVDAVGGVLFAEETIDTVGLLVLTAAP